MSGLEGRVFLSSNLGVFFTILLEKHKFISSTHINFFP